MRPAQGPPSGRSGLTRSGGRGLLGGISSGEGANIQTGWLEQRCQSLAARGSGAMDCMLDTAVPLKDGPKQWGQGRARSGTRERYHKLQQCRRATAAGP